MDTTFDPTEFLSEERLIGYHVVMECDTCNDRGLGFVYDRTGGFADVLLEVLTAGWSADHHRHQQMVIVSPATLDGEGATV